MCVGETALWPSAVMLSQLVRSLCMQHLYNHQVLVQHFYNHKAALALIYKHAWTRHDLYVSARAAPGAPLKYLSTFCQRHGRVGGYLEQIRLSTPLPMPVAHPVNHAVSAIMTVEVLVRSLCGCRELHTSTWCCRGAAYNQHLYNHKVP
jgi:hypothetical protein